MPKQLGPIDALAAWEHILGNDPQIIENHPGRDLWLVRAHNESQFFLKQLSPWRNLPFIDERRVLRYLSGQGVGVAGFLPTAQGEHSTSLNGDSYVLMPKLASDAFLASEILGLEGTIGSAIAELHLALHRYPEVSNSYNEDIVGSLRGKLDLPIDVSEMFAAHRDGMAAAISRCPTQLIHGDLSPDNVILRRPGEVSGFIDFDHLPIGPRIWDVGKYLSRRLRMDWRRDHPDANHDRTDHILLFLRGYQQVVPLRASEIEALPAAILAGNILEISYFAQISTGVLDRRKLDDHDEVLADSIEAARWHLQNYENVEAAVNQSVQHH